MRYLTWKDTKIRSWLKASNGFKITLSILSIASISIAETSGLYYKPMTIVNDDATVVNNLEASFTDDARVIIYDRHMFIVQATD